MSIQEVDQISITILMDNSTDLLLKNSTHATRAPLTMNEKFGTTASNSGTWILCLS